jgi:hypothetical protein
MIGFGHFSLTECTFTISNVEAGLISFFLKKISSYVLHAYKSKVLAMILSSFG